MSEFLFITVVAALVSGGLFTRSLLERHWPEGLVSMAEANNRAMR